jgi:hypothetical protein
MAFLLNKNMKEKIKNTFYYLTSKYRFRQDVKNYFTPKQKWLTKKIPNHWCDKVELIPICLFEMLVHFVEKEMDNVCWDWQSEVGEGYVSQEYADNYKERQENILQIYKWIKTDRPAMEKENQRLVNLSFPEDGNLSFSLTKEEKEFLLAAHTIEIEIDKKDQEMLHKIIDVRQYLWT